MKLLYFFIFLSISFQLFSQSEKTIEEWKKENNISLSDFKEYTTISTKISEKELENDIVKQKKIAKDEIRKSLCEGLDGNLDKVIHLNDLELYFVEKDKKNFRVYCVVNKKQLSSFWIKDLEAKYDNLKYSLNEQLISGTTKSAQIEEMLKKTKLTRQELAFYEDVIRRVDPEIEMDNINLTKQDIDANINSLNSRLDKTAVIEKTKKAFTLLSSNKFIAAYKSFKELALEYPNNLEITEGKNQAFNLLIQYYEGKISEYELNAEYKSALSTIDSLINLDFELNKKYSDKKSQLIDNQFNSLITKIEKILSYKTVSGEQLKELMSDLTKIKNVNLKKYEDIRGRSESKLLDYDIRIVKSDLYNKKFSSALGRIPDLKYTYSRNKRIEKLEQYVDKKMYHYFKKEILSTRPRQLNLEMGCNIVTPITSLDSTKNLNYYNLNLLYSIGLYKRLSIKPKGNSKYAYSTIGLKFSYLDGTNTLNERLTNTSISRASYYNPEISLGIRKCLFLDIGYMGQTLLQPKNMSTSLSFYIPLGYFSLGINSKLFTDFKNQPFIQVGAGIKLNFGLVKVFNAQDKEEVETQILKLKQ
jgi:hypothetical protein